MPSRWKYRKIETNSMLNTLQTHAPDISILLLATLIIALLFAPNAIQILSVIIIVFGSGTAVVFTVKDNQEKKEENNLSQKRVPEETTFLDLVRSLLPGMILRPMLPRSAWQGRYCGKCVKPLAKKDKFLSGTGVESPWRLLARTRRAIWGTLKPGPV